MSQVIVAGANPATEEPQSTETTAQTIADAMEAGAQIAQTAAAQATFNAEVSISELRTEISNLGSEIRATLASQSDRLSTMESRMNATAAAAETALEELANEDEDGLASSTVEAVIVDDAAATSEATQDEPAPKRGASGFYQALKRLRVV